jgi:hypothetical protein
MTMKTLSILTGMLLFFSACNPDTAYRTITPDVLKDKIAGGWAGKMIGVTYGAPTEFRAQGTPYNDSIRWVPADIRGSLWQDDLYVQLTFLMTMDRYGTDAPAKKFQELFAKAGYPLWHANVQARKNYFDSIFPPQSGRPEYNFHADDIDFQIEADYVGFMCPGMPATATSLCDKIGHIMNYGDGYYGGVFVAALYAEAFFESDITRVIQSALRSLPAESDYAKIVSDVMLLHEHYPADWTAAWKELENKWGADHICGAGSTFNIDAKLNGAYIVMGLLYGEGDPMKTLEIATRCGQDSDCNPSNALAVLGVIKGFSNLPNNMKGGINAIADSNFINTDYSFNKAVKNTYDYALGFIKKDGGMESGQVIRIRTQEPSPALLEVAFPDLVFDHNIGIRDKAWTLKGKWKPFNTDDGKGQPPVFQSLWSGQSGDEATVTFEGTGVVLNGNWVKDGGKAEVILDGKPAIAFDTYFFRSGQEHRDMNLWHVFRLQQGTHTLKVVVKGEKRPEAADSRIYLTGIGVFKTAPKKSAVTRFSFQ